MIPIRAITTVFSLVLLSTLAACWGKDGGRTTCDEPQAYQAVVPSKRVVAPEGLDDLDDFREMPIPKSDSPPRAEGAECIESPPAINSGSS